MSGITSLQLRASTRIALAALLSLLISLLALGPAIAQLAPVATTSDGSSTLDPVAHLVVSELVTGATSASDEFIEIYNPSPDALPLEGLELIYVSASGATVTRKAAWAAGAPFIAPGAHSLVANAAGAYAPLADATYANGLAATGGSVALRIQGATTGACHATQPTSSISSSPAHQLHPQVPPRPQRPALRRVRRRRRPRPPVRARPPRRRLPRRPARRTPRRSPSVRLEPWRPVPRFTCAGSSRWGMGSSMRRPR